MPDQENSVEAIVLTRLMRLNARIYGAVTGLVAGLILFIATNWLVLQGGPVVGPHLALLNQFFIGYRVTFAGSFVGLAYGIVVGFMVGYSVARIYNWLVELKDKRHSARRVS
jgi:hypothetical protein